MKLANARSVFLFTISITVLVLVASVLMNVLVFPHEIWPVTMRGTVLIVMVVAVPVSWFIGRKIRENTQLSEELRALVERDRLTDVATRDFFFSMLARDEDAYGVSLMVDIDHFKDVNDTYGHLAGDDVITQVAHVMRDEVREDDIVCRFGGEEFLVFLRQATKQEGWQIAERIRQGTEALVTQTNIGPVSVTVSVGGSLKDRIEDVEASIKRADACLYRAKAVGRNATVVDWDDPQPVQLVQRAG